MASKDRYDLIIPEPSNPWISGISNLFTSEFFALAHQHLAPGGIMTQWFHTYSMSTDDLKTITGTYALLFPYVTVWTSGSGDLIMTGSDDPQLFELQWCELAQPEVNQWITLSPKPG